MRQSTRRIALFFCLTLCLALLTTGARAQTYTVLYNFTGPCGANFAFGGVTLDEAGRIYGTVASGGANDGGVVYRLSHEGQGWICLPLYGFGYQDHRRPDDL